MGIMDEYQDEIDQWEYDHCEHFEDKRMLDLSTVTSEPKQAFECLSCGKITDEDHIECDHEGIPVCPKCGEHNLEPVVS